METITIQVGTVVRIYKLFLTRAPRAYDGFGTITIQGSSAGDERLVAIDQDHETWQVGRYGSGMYSAEPAGKFFDGIAQDVLLKRLVASDDD